MNSMETGPTSSVPEVTLKPYATFRACIGGRSSVTVPITVGQSIAQLLVQVGIPVEEARIVFCNNRIVELGYPLQGGETVGVFPAIGGG